MGNKDSLINSLWISFLHQFAALSYHENIVQRNIPANTLSKDGAHDGTPYEAGTSINTASPCPPPLQIAAIPSPPPRRFNS